MKPYLHHLLSNITDPDDALPVMREYLQARILEGLQQVGAFHCLSFHGGTALRFLYDIPRYSEDLDFALDFQPDAYDFNGYLQAIQKKLYAENYDVSIRAKKEQPIVNKAFIRFRGLMHELGISPHDNQVFSVKLEVDTNPAPNSISETTLLKRHVDLHIHHHDKASLFAGKLNAVLERMYIKGRDWYDLWWYLSQPGWPLPNFAYLNSGLRQGGSVLPELNETNWRAILQERTEKLDWSAVLADVEPFIIDFTQQEETFNKAHLLTLLATYQTEKE